MFLEALLIYLTSANNTHNLPLHSSTTDGKYINNSELPTIYRGLNCLNPILDPLMKRYRGFVNTTKSGLPCQRWDAQSPNKHKFHPIEEWDILGMDHPGDNYCRYMHPIDNTLGGPGCFDASNTGPEAVWETCDIVTCPVPDHSKICSIKVINRFVKWVCEYYDPALDEKVQYARCLLSNDTFYRMDMDTNVLVCPEDPRSYQMCGLSNIGPESSIEPDAPLCGGYICKLRQTNNEVPLYKDGGSLSSRKLQVVNPRIFCNGIRNCENTDREEDKCGTEDVTVYPFTKTTVDSKLVCNNKCDLGTCEDESYCNGVSYGVSCNYDMYIQLGMEIPGYIPAPLICDEPQVCEGFIDEEGCNVMANEPSCIHFNRKYNDKEDFYNSKDFGIATRLVPIPDNVRCANIDYDIGEIAPGMTNVPYCENFRDQTNCTDPAKVAFSCLVDTYPTTISKSALCHQWHPAELCDDRLENMCPQLSAVCVPHKHVICDGKIDCADQADEAHCDDFLMTNETCERIYGDTPMKMPLTWLLDDVDDCKDKRDEKVDYWPKCGNNPYTRYVTENVTGCSDVFICPESGFVEFNNLCDGVGSCLRENEVCKTSWGLSDLYTAVQKSPIDESKGMIYCLDGLTNMESLAHPCTNFHFRYPDLDVFGVDSHRLLKIPFSHFDCQHTYGELYVYLSCTGNCPGTVCPLTKPIKHDSCQGQFPDRIFSLSGYDFLTFVGEEKGMLRTFDLFVCDNNKCIPYLQVCDLVNNCGDYSDERFCRNNFQCETSLKLIGKNQICNNVVDCLDLSDECNDGCGKNILEGIALKAASWVIGVLAAILNMVIIVESLSTILACKTTVSLTNKMLIMLISLGDLMVGLYLIAVAIADYMYSNKYCMERLRSWLTSGFCSTLGIVSTVGSTISLLAMTTLSLIRMIGIKNSMSIPAELNKKGALKVASLVLSLIGAATALAVTPVIPLFEDYFVNGMYYDPKTKVFIGTPDKEKHINTLRAYFGRMRSGTSLSWESLRSLSDGMFTHDNNDLVRKNVEFYGNDAVCLFKYFVTQDDPQRAFVWITIIINLTCFALITISYIVINLISMQSSKAVGGAKDRNKKMQRKITIIIATDFACWIPFLIVCMLHSGGLMDATSWYAFFSMVMLPLNAVINPLLYDDTITKHLPIEAAVKFVSQFKTHKRNENEATKK